MGSAHGPYPHPQEKSQQSKVRFNNEGKPSPKRGYTYHTFEVKDDLYKQFASKARDSSKSQKEVINQLISFFNMGKIKI